MKHLIFILLGTLFCVLLSYSQNIESKDSEYLSSESRVIVRKVYSPGLENNLLNDAPLRSVSIYLPPGYGDDPGRRYPLIYFLHGLTQEHSSWWDAGMFADIDMIMDKLLNQNKISPMIIVLPSSNNKYRGSWYTNSSVTGKWEDFIIKDIVNYVDRNFRTLPQADSRGLAGHSMGGYGTFKIVMRNPGLFCSAYGLSPACMIFNDVILNKGLYNLISALRAKNFEDLDWRIQASIGMAAAFAPNPNVPFYGEIPVKDGGELIDSVWQKWLKHDPYSLLPVYKDNLSNLNAIQFDCGTEDSKLIDANIRFSEELMNLGIDHIFETYPGDHVNKLYLRVETELLPFFSTHLADTMLTDTVLPDLISWKHIKVDEHSDSVGTIPLDTASYKSDSMSYSLIAGDPDNVFTINSLTGEIVADSIKLDYETGEREHDLIIAAMYKYNSILIADTGNVFIEVKDKYEPLLQVWDTSFVIDENSPAGTTVGMIPYRNPEGQPLSFAIIDGNINGTFSMGWFGLGNIKVANAESLDFESITRFVLTVTVEELNEGICKDTVTITVNLEDVAEETVTFDKADSKFEIYPNPVTDILIIQTKNHELHNIEIISSIGQLIFFEEMEGSSHQIDLSSYQKGVYFITIRSEDFVSTRKIIKL